MNNNEYVDHMQNHERTDLRIVIIGINLFFLKFQEG